MAVEIPIPNRAAAERADIPSAEAARTRLRRSSLNARDIPISLIRRQRITANSDCHLNSDSAFNGRALVVRMNGPLIINDSLMLEAAALDGLGLAYTFESQVSQYIADGRLIRVLDDWCQPFPGYHLYYPSRRQHTAAFALLVEALRFKG
ncbi:LysR substrate-binding domain-containing protein [Rhizobium beringeri]|uniref:LysR substrate-binding domain-containing protein n=1 Tax=Rhizobium beringeri TaxID=3019934 RepID=UPI003B5AEC3E